MCFPFCGEALKETLQLCSPSDKVQSLYNKRMVEKHKEEKTWQKQQSII